MFHTGVLLLCIINMCNTMVLSTIVGKSASDLEVTPKPKYFYLPGQFTIQKRFESSLIPLLNNIHIQWYHNGTTVDESRTNSSLETQGERFTLSLTVFNETEEIDSGLYEGTASVGLYNFYVSTGRYYNYYHYAHYYLGLWFSNLQVVYFPVVILQYSKLIVRQVKLA